MSKLGAMCADGRRAKVPHRSYAGALLHATDLEARKGRRCRVYACPYCGFFHVGRPATPATRTRKRRRWVDGIELGPRARAMIETENGRDAWRRERFVAAMARKAGFRAVARLVRHLP